jgi:Carboxypeptidase regulatory-like domain
MRLRLALLLLVMSPLGPAAADPWRTSHSLGAMPGVYRVATAEPQDPGVAFYTGAGYGFASGVMGEDDVHHRLGGSLAASFRALPWLAAGFRMDGRFDQHTGLASIDQEDDDGLVGEPRILLHAGGSLNDAWHAGARVTVWLPGSEAPSIVFGAVTPDAVAMLTYAPPGGALRLGANAGFRLDRSAASAEDADLLSQADRLSLGVSDASAVLVGLGATYRLGSVDILGELTWDLLLGEDAPELRGSPMRVAAGVRVPVLEILAAELVVESNLAELPSAAAGEPLVPYEPRISVGVGLHYRFGASRAKPRTTPAEQPETPEPETPPAARTGVIRGRVQGAGGVAVPSAAVTVEIGGAPREVALDAEGRFRVDDVPPGPVTVSVRAEGFEPATRSLTLAAGDDQELAIELERALPPGQLRGFVRSFGGKPVAAELTIESAGEPLGTTITAAEDGSFEIDVAPGQYDVVIRAPGYREQRRSVTIEQGGVLILNVDLRRQN